MRRAKQNDYWRAIERHQGWKIHIDRVAFSDVQGIGTGELKFSSPLNFLCGPNGVGKTTILRAIGATLVPSEARDSASTRFRLSDGRMAATVRNEETTETVETVFSNLEDAPDWNNDAEVFHVDTSSVVSDLQNYFCDFPNIQDALNGVPILEASDEGLEILSYLTHIQYTAARVYTIEETILEPSRDDETVERPFFEVQTAGSVYDSRSMGLGELAAFYLWWSLERVSDKTILLIEEPESFLSPLCQTAFAGVLAKYTASKKPFVVVTTHSPQIIQSAPKSSLHFVYRDGRNSKINIGDPLEVLLNTVGIEAKIKTLVMVEDNAARVFSKLWIGQFAPRIIASIEFIIMNGDGNIIKALDGFPTNPNSFALIGLLDGDAEGKGFAGERIGFLPGGKPVEALYREMIEAELDRVEPILGIENLRQVVFAQQGLELHEWFE